MSREADVIGAVIRHHVMSMTWLCACGWQGPDRHPEHVGAMAAIALACDGFELIPPIAVRGEDNE